MPAALTLLDGVRWRGTPITGDRPAALLAALASAPSGLSDAALVEEIWGDDPPAHPAKALQVLVSRLRTLDRTLVIREGGGYRLGLVLADVDAWALREAATVATTAWTAGDAAGALLAAEQVAGYEVGDGVGALGELRAGARGSQQALERIRGLALAQSGRHGAAAPVLARVLAERPDDAEVLTAQLRGTGSLQGPAAALAAYERYRHGLAERLGVDPDPQLQRLHAELLVADRPVRSGVQYDGPALLGREEDLERLRAALAVSRLTTILGPGGLGKTSIAQVLARESRLPRVHVVELVGVTDSDDVVAEVGAALGIRGSLPGRNALTPAQQADVRGRLAEELDSAPALLVLDNCEHVLEAVASLVAFLTATTRELRVLTTSRAPLRIASERVVPLSLLGPDDAAALFRRRARDQRPDAVLRDAEVASVIDRLDGLPLAIELAAARVRTMSVSEVAAALSDRLGVLRTRDRSAPVRHRTLGAVIAWSWDLLTPAEQRASARLSLFHDGFSSDAAEALLGPEAADLVEGLVDQSLLVVTEVDGQTRFRTLETIREFAAQRLDESGDRPSAEAAHHGWAEGLAERAAGLFVSPDQLALIDTLVREENNLTDVLRRGLSRRRPEQVVTLLAALVSLWTITGNHARVFAVTEAAEDLLRGWQPAPELLSAAQDATAVILLHASWLGGPDPDLRATFDAWGPGVTPWAESARTLFLSEEGPERSVRLQELAAGAAEPTVRAMHRVWLSMLTENEGDLEGAAAHARAGLAYDDLAPYVLGSLHAQLAQLAVAMGDPVTAAEHAREAWPILERLHAEDDALSMRLTVAVSHLADGDTVTCRRELDLIGEEIESGQLGSRTLLASARAELAIAEGDEEAGVALYDAAFEQIRELVRDPALSLAPWVTLACAGALVAHVRYGDDGARQRAATLAATLRRQAERALDTGFRDLPFGGLVVLGVACQGLRWGPPEGRERQVELLAIADRWGYNRSLPVVAWPHIRELAERFAPGLLDHWVAVHAETPSAELRARVGTLLGVGA